MKKSTSRIFSILIAAVLFINFNASSQQKRIFYLSQLNSITTDSFTINLSTTNFNNITDFQFSVDWDTSVISYVGNIIPNTALSFNSYKYNATKRGVGFAWFDTSLLGVSVPDSTVLMSLKYVFKNGYSSGIIAPIWFGNIPTTIGKVDTSDGNYTTPDSVPFSLINGYVSTAKSAVPTIAINGTILTAVTVGATPIYYQWYRLAGTPPVYTAISGANNSTYNYNGVPGNYVVVATFANGDKDTSAQLLPLKLLSFKGSNSNSSTVLNWVTTNEYNAAAFIVERSSDGINYSQIGKIAAINNEYTEQSYRFLDDKLTADFIFYYRLKMMDNSGSYSYSSVVKLNKAGKTIFQIQPNPIVNATVKVVGKQMKLANVYDSNGKLVLSQQLYNANKAILRLNNPSKGIYTLNIISTDNESQTEQFMVK